MADDYQWLLLKGLNPVCDSHKPSCGVHAFITVPKNVIPLAAHRNRIKRILREAVRGSIFFRNVKKRLVFRVVRIPKKINLETAKKTVETLVDEYRRENV